MKCPQDTDSPVTGYTVAIAQVYPAGMYKQQVSGRTPIYGRSKR